MSEATEAAVADACTAGVPEVVVRTASKKPKKVVKAAVKPAKASKGVKATPVIPSSNSPLHKGSTRMRLFKALKGFSDGLTASTIKVKTGMLPNSGHLAVLLGEEVEAKRIKKSVASDANEKVHTIYLLTAKGLKDLEAGEIDGNKYAGNRIGQLWTKPRIKAQKELASTIRL